MHTLAAALCALGLVAGCRPRDQNTREGVPAAASPSEVVAAAPPSSVAPLSAATTTPFSLTMLPPAALEVLGRLAPGFRLIERGSYPDSVARSAHESPDAGLVFLRGDFQGLGRTDYTVVGYQRGSYRVVALFAGADGTFRALDVIPPASEADMTLSPGVPPLLLESDKCEAACWHGLKPRVIVVTWFLASRFGVHQTRYVWDGLSEFMLDEVIDDP